MQTHPIKSIQALRGIAALLVVVFHYKWYVGLESEGGLVGALVSAGGVGVTLFFILSGFIMIYSAKEKTTPVDFAINRFSRIYPAYLFFIVLCFAVGGAMSTFHYEDKTVSLITSFLFLPTGNVDAPAYIDLNSISAVRWTLNYEMFFYSILFISMFFKNKNIFLISSFVFLLILLPAVTGFKPSLSIKGYNYDSVILSYITNPIMYEFLAGVIIALFVSRINTLCGSMSRLLILAVSIAMVIFFCFYKGFNDHGFESSAGYLSILFLAVVLNKDFLDSLTPKVLVYLGEISFSIYLLHNPIMFIVNKYVYHGNYGWYSVTTSLFLTFVISYFSHKYLEVKASRWLKKTLHRIIQKSGKREQERTNL